MFHRDKLTLKSKVSMNPSKRKAALVKFAVAYIHEDYDSFHRAVSKGQAIKTSNAGDKAAIRKL